MGNIPPGNTQRCLVFAVRFAYGEFRHIGYAPIFSAVRTSQILGFFKNEFIKLPRLFAKTKHKPAYPGRSILISTPALAPLN